MSQRPSLRTVLPVLVGLGVFMVPMTGCGAAVSSYLILNAQAELDGAEAAEADKYAPYEYTKAQQYLHKAREEQGYADFGPAIEYAFSAQEYAELGRKKADEAKSLAQPPPASAPVEVPVSGEGAAPSPTPVPPPQSSPVIIEQQPQAPNGQQPKVIIQPQNQPPPDAAPVEIEIEPLQPTTPEVAPPSSPSPAPATKKAPDDDEKKPAPKKIIIMQPSGG